MTISKIVIIGGGMAGVGTAIAITSALAEVGVEQLPAIVVCELRNEPSTIGGAVNLTPTAMKCLDILKTLDEIKAQNSGCETKVIQLVSLHNGSSLGDLDYRGKDGTGYGGQFGMRIMRGELLNAMIAAVRKFPNVEILYGKKAARFAETSNNVTVEFEDGTSITADMILGADGIHSATRTKFVEPSRVAEYSGIASAYSFSPVSDELRTKIDPYFKDAALAMARRGAILTSFCENTRKKLYIGALMESKQQISKDGWRALGADKEAVKREVVDRFQESALPYMKEVVNNTDDWFLYPVYVLSPRGKWHTSRVMLVGDAAHAMPPKGESIGFALEDAVIFSRVVSRLGLDSTPEAIFTCFEQIRREPIEAARKDAGMGWNMNKDSGWLFTKIMEWVTPVYLSATKRSREKGFSADPRDIKFPC